MTNRMLPRKNTRVKRSAGGNQRESPTQARAGRVAEIGGAVAVVDVAANACQNPSSPARPLSCARTDRLRNERRPSRKKRSPGAKRPRPEYGPPPGYQPMILPGESISKYQRLAQAQPARRLCGDLGSPIPVQTRPAPMRGVSLRMSRSSRIAADRSAIDDGTSARIQRPREKCSREYRSRIV